MTVRSNYHPIIYLAGPIAECSDTEANDWRTEAKEELNRRDIPSTVLDPMARDLRHLHYMSDEQCVYIVENDKAEIDSANILLVNAWKIGVGTSMEILYAYEAGNKKIILIHPKDKRISPWFRYHCDEIHHDLKSAMDSIEYSVFGSVKEYR